MDPSQGWKGRDKPNQGMGAETRAMIGNPAARGSDQTIRPNDAEVPESIGFEEAEMTPEMTPQPVPQAGESVPAELAPPAEMTAGDSFFDLRPPAEQVPVQPEVPVDMNPDSEPVLPANRDGLPQVSNEMDSDALVAHNAALAQEVESLREQLQQTAQVPALTAEIHSLQQQLVAAQQQAANYRDQAQRLQEELAGAAPASEIARLTALVQGESVTRKELEEDLRLAREEVEHARAEHGALMAEIEALRAAPAPQADTAELEKALQEAARLRAALDEATSAVASVQRSNEELMRQMAAQNSQMHEAQRARAEIAAQLQAREAEITSLHAEMAQAAPVPAPDGKRGKGSADLEAQIKTLKKELATKEKEVKETREALDSEAARSFRLSQRRIPALQNELAEAHAQGMEVRRKMEKLEAEKRTLADAAESAQRQMEELERALAAAKARMQDTTIIAAPEQQTSPADEEVKRLAGRLKAAEEERRKLSESLQQIDKGKRSEIEKYEERLARMQAESNERHENYLGLRKQLKLLAGRLAQTVKLAAMLAAATSDGQRKMLIDGIEKLGKESEAVGAGQNIELATLAPPPSAPTAADSAPHPAVQQPPASQAPAVTEKDKKESSRTEIIQAPQVAAPAPQPPSAQSVAAPEDLVEPSAEPMSLDGPSLDPGLDGIPDDIGGPATDL